MSALPCSTVNAYRRARVGAAVGLVSALAVGLVATSHMGRAREQPAARAAAPSLARCHDPTPREPYVHCVLDGVEVDYRLIRAPLSVNAGYLDAIGPTDKRPGTGPAGCTHGGEDERTWSWPSRPRRVAGRFACRREHGRAAMWWTVARRGLLAHAVAPDADLASLFAWWLLHSER